jgi:hypothetical protein
MFYILPLYCISVILIYLIYMKNVGTLLYTAVQR